MGLHTEMYFASNPTEEDAFVLSVEKSKLSVIVPRFGIEGTVRETLLLQVVHLGIIESTRVDVHFILKGKEDLVS